MPGLFLFMTCLFNLFGVLSQKNSQIFEADIFDELYQVITLEGIGHETRRNLASTKEIKFKKKFIKFTEK